MGLLELEAGPQWLGQGFLPKKEPSDFLLKLVDAASLALQSIWTLSGVSRPDICSNTTPTVAVVLAVSFF